MAATNMVEFHRHLALGEIANAIDDVTIEARYGTRTNARHMAAILVSMGIPANSRGTGWLQ